MRLTHEAPKSRRIGTGAAARLGNMLKQIFRRIDWEEIGRLLAIRDDRPN